MQDVNPEGAPAKTRIVIFAVPYSPNLGDGIIAECLAAGLTTHNGITVTHRDVSGRQEFGSVVVGNRARLLTLLDRLPLWIAQRLVKWRFGRILPTVQEDWQEAIASADIVMIGGGQLFSDAHLNFCLKIAAVADLAREVGRPVVVYGAGVARNWTPQGRDLFARLLCCDLRLVGLRDQRSIDNWTDQMQGGPAPVLTRDPGLLAAVTYAKYDAGSKGGIGLCVTSPQVLTHHGGSSATLQLDVMAEIAERIVTEGHRVSLFCNGAAEDRDAVAGLAAHPLIAPLVTQGQIAIAPFPDRPRDLATMIAAFDAVIAHRLHACIVAFAFKRPVIGLGWDDKLESFFASADLMANFLPAKQIDADNVFNRLSAALKNGVNSDKAHEAEIEARGALGLVLEALENQALEYKG